MYFQLLDNGRTIQGGELVTVTTAHGHQLDEYKTYFNGASDYTAPCVVFRNGEQITVDLKMKKNGFAGGLVTHGFKYGANFNRVQNKQSRWGLTVWCEPVKQAATV